MGIWGSLNEIALPELLLMLEDRTGVLTLREGRRPAVSLEVAQGRAGRALEGRRPLSRVELEERLLNLMIESRASFGFYPNDRMGPVVGPKLRSLALKLSTLFDEIQPALHQLPNPRARFHLISAKLLGNVRWDPLFLKAMDALEKGASAEELAEVLGVPRLEARYFLLLLSRARRVRPEPAAAPARPKGVSRIFARILAEA